MLKGFCDPRCWHARGKICRCWCNGMNHGLGNEEMDAPMRQLLNSRTVNKYGLTEEMYELYLLAQNKDEALQKIEAKLKEKFEK